MIKVVFEREDKKQLTISLTKRMVERIAALMYPTSVGSSSPAKGYITIMDFLFGE